ncbi:MAG: hypothetical protein MUD17_11350 [Gemmatimonadaceae bacterium]|jgi:hypothetical protein|nr:hypothetical protein [Gemmatimonadaceae bacterium]
MSGTPRRLAPSPPTGPDGANYLPPSTRGISYEDPAGRVDEVRAPVLVIAGERVEVWEEPVSAAIRALELMHTRRDLATLQLPDAALMREAMRRTLEAVPRERWRNLEREAPYLLPAPIDDFPMA